MIRKTSTKPRIARFPEKKLGRPPSSEGLSTFTANELQATDFPPLKFLVEGLITEGLTLLAGKPKMGKSWMALDIAMSVAIGCEALGNRPCEKGVALYCALEDNPRRLRRRMLHNYGDQINWPVDFHFATQMNRLDEGGFEDLEDWISEHQPSLIILDTLARMKPTSKGKNEYEADYAALLPLQELAGKHGISIIVIHHLRKMTGDDPLDMVSGTTGLTGAVDNVLVLDRKSDGVTLYGRGREMETSIWHSNSTMGFGEFLVTLTPLGFPKNAERLSRSCETPMGRWDRKTSLTRWTGLKTTCASCSKAWLPTARSTS